MAKQSRSGKPVQVYVTEEVRAELEAMADGNRRPLASEVRLAIEFYLANPEVVGRWASLPVRAPTVAPEAPEPIKQEDTPEPVKPARKPRKGL